GPICFAPASEQIGRRWITVITFFFFTVFTMACAVAPNFPSFLIFRLMCGISASAPMVIAAGIFADIFGDPRSRGRSMAFFMVATVFGPLIGPIISGYCAETIGWRWTFWIGTIYAAITLLFLFTLPETYGPILLQRRAERIRKADPTSRVFAPHELEKPNLKTLYTVVLTRPIRMMMSELIVSLSSAYLSMVYGVFYMSFSAYPIIFQGVYKMSPGVCGLTYLVVGAGAFLSLPPFYWWDDYLFKKQQANVPWAHQEEYRRLPLACVGGPLYAVSLFWLGWSAREDVHWACPMMAGLFFGMGWMLIFIALLNYLTDAYEIFAASANAAAAMARSIVAVVLPLCTQPLFARLGIAGACSLLGGLAVLFSAVPFLFIWQGVKIRANSKFCVYLKQRKEEIARKAEVQRERERESLERKGGGGERGEEAV
ncbi:major facilitator superfamily domain-containing protein, partial [Coniochaeta sp. 2T2.1]